MEQVKQGFTATPEQIAEWKKKHGDIYAIEVEKGAYRAYVHAPTRKTMGYAGTVAASDPIKFNEIILNQSWIDGDEEIKTDDRLFMGVCGQLDKIIETAEVEIKKAVKGADAYAPGNAILYLDTLLQYHLGIQHPEDLPTEIWAAKLAVLQRIREEEAKGNKTFEF